MRSTDYIGAAFVTEPDGDEVEVRAVLHADGDEWGGSLTGPTDWIALAAHPEPFFALRLPSGPPTPVFISGFDQAATTSRVSIVGVGPAPFHVPGRPGGCPPGSGAATGTVERVTDARSRADEIQALQQEIAELTESLGGEIELEDRATIIEQLEVDRAILAELQAPHPDG
jgi:hypothetical protein